MAMADALRPIRRNALLLVPILLGVLAPAAEATSACPEGILFNPVLVVTTTLQVPWTVHHCGVDQVITILEDLNGNFLAAGGVGASCPATLGHQDSSGVLTLAAPFTGLAKMTASFSSCSGSVPPETASFPLIAP